MKRRIVALFHFPWPVDGMVRPPASRPFEQFRYAIWYKANPRSPEYMQALQRELVPNAEWLDAREHSDWRGRLADVDEIVLLYPDSIGLGLSRVERAVMAHKPAPASVSVLNGRRRKFRLNRVTLFGLRVRRLLEWTMLPELMLLPVFIIATPVLMAVDAVRRRT